MLYESSDRNHGVNIWPNGKDGEYGYIAMAVQRDRNQFEYWFTIGHYKTEANALKYSRKKMLEHGYTI